MKCNFSFEYFKNTLFKTENILIYIPSRLVFSEFKSQLEKYLLDNNINYEIRGFTDIQSRVYEKPTIFYTLIPYSPIINLKLLSTFIENRVDKVFLLNSSGEIEYLLG